jgi:hypothetical protein
MQTLHCSALNEVNVAAISEVLVTEKTERMFQIVIALAHGDRRVIQGCTNLGHQGTKFCKVAPNICGSSVWNLLPITTLAPRILTWLLDSWTISTQYQKCNTQSSTEHVKFHKRLNVLSYILNWSDRCLVLPLYSLYAEIIGNRSDKQKSRNLPRERVLWLPSVLLISAKPSRLKMLASFF